MASRIQCFGVFTPLFPATLGVCHRHRHSTWHHRTTPSSQSVDVLDDVSGAVQTRYNIGAVGIAVRPSAVPEPGVTMFLLASVVCVWRLARGRRRTSRASMALNPEEAR
jgi:hypothetical protein